MQEVDYKMMLLLEILGPKTRGNKRHSHPLMFRDLLEAFLYLQSIGVTLPKGGNLSKKAVMGGVGQVLKCHYYTDRTVDKLLIDSQERRRLGKVMKSIFCRVAAVVESNQASKV